jgi:hypothetical protein
MNRTGNLFDAVVEASGLLALIAPYTISRLLIGAGASPQALTREELREALPHLEAGLAVYLSDEQLAQAMANFRRLVTADEP